MRPTSINTIDPQEGENLSIAGGNYRIVLSGAQTNGAFAAIEMLVPPQGGPGPHAHSAIQESFYVLEGEVVFKSETQVYTAKKGAMVSIPNGGAVHCFKNESDQTARLMCIVVPAGLEAFFKEIGKPVAPGVLLPQEPMNPDILKKVMEIGARYGQEFFPPDYLDKK